MGGTTPTKYKAERNMKIRRRLKRSRQQRRATERQEVGKENGGGGDGLSAWTMGSPRPRHLQATCQIN